MLENSNKIDGKSELPVSCCSRENERNAWGISTNNVPESGTLLLIYSDKINFFTTISLFCFVNGKTFQDWLGVIFFPEHFSFCL